MIAERYGIQLESLKSQNLSMALDWRNADHVRTQMSFREIISLKNHEEWFRSLSHTQDFYFIFSEEKKPAGIVNLKSVDWENKTAEAGVFTGDKNYLNSSVPYRAVLVLMELAFYILQLETLSAKVESGNKTAEKFNESLGYEYTSDEGTARYYQVDEKKFRDATLRIRKTLAKEFSSDFRISPEKGDSFLAPLIRRFNPRTIPLK